MMIHSRITQLSVLALAIAGTFAAGQAHAAAFQLKENSVKAQGRSMAGSASAYGDASVVVNNPAMMSTFERTTIQGDVTAIDLSFKFNGSGQAAAGTPLQQPLRGSNGGEAGDLTPVPAASFILPLSDDFEYLTLGAMISAPFGLKTEYENGWVGRYNALESDVKIVDLTLAASVELSDKFSVGLGLIYEHSDVTLSNAVDFGSGICRLNPRACVTPNPTDAVFGPQKNDGIATVNGTDNSLGWLVGLSWRPVENVSIGYTHRSEIDHEVRGTGKFDVPGNVRAALNGAGASALYTNGGAGAKLTTPSVDTLSVTWYVNDQFSLMAEGSKTDWHSLKEIRIEFDNPAQPDAVEDYNWHDSWFYALGAEYKINDAFTLRGGIARDESPIAFQHRTPRMPDQDRNWYSVGLTWAPSENFELSAAYTMLKMNKDPEIAIASSSGSYLTGKYDASVNLYGISAQYKF